MPRLTCVPGTFTYYDRPMLQRLLAGIWRDNLTRGGETEHFQNELAAYFGSVGAVCQAMARVVFARLLRSLALPHGSEVILHPFTMVDIVNAIVSAGLRPVFVDLAPLTYSIDPEAIARAVTPRSRLLLVTNLFGLTPDMDRLTELARRHNLILIEDVSQAMGCRWRGKALGTFGRAGFLSLGSLKTCSTLFGGVLLSDDRGLLNAVCQAGTDDPPPPRMAFSLFILKFLLYEWLVAPHRYSNLLFPLSRDLHHRWPGLHYRLLGGNYAIVMGEGRIPQRQELAPEMFFRYTDLQAREGRRRLVRVDALDDTRRAVTDRFMHNLDPVAHHGLPAIATNARHGFWRFPFRVRDRNRFAAHLFAHGFDTTVNYLPLCSELPHFQDGTKILPEARAVRDATVLLPLHPSLTDEQVDHLAAAVNGYCRAEQ